MIKIDVSVEEIVSLIQELMTTCSYLEEKTTRICKEIEECMDEIRSRINRLESLRLRADQTNTKLEMRKDEVSKNLERTKQSLQHEKKEIEIVHYDEEGKKYIERKPNPQYIQLQDNLEKYEIELKDIQEKITKCEEIIKQIDNFSIKLSTAIGNIELSENQVVYTKNENINGLNSAIQKLRWYQELVEQYSEKRFII